VVEIPNHAPEHEQLTERQKREIAYHSQRAALVREVDRPLSFDVLTKPERRWWNHHWSDYSILLKAGVNGKTVLVVGCGEGSDAIRLAMLGADVHAFDISADMIAVAKERARDEGLRVDFQEMAAENLNYGDNTFDVLFALDILHHCDLERCLPEIVRVAKPDAFLLVDELYTHRMLQRLRESELGCALRELLIPVLYPNFRGKIDTYVTEDERKLNDGELSTVRGLLNCARCHYFSMVVNRFLPSWDLAAKLDRLALKLLGPAGYLLAGRFIVSGFVRK
jgi:ubiquinone/menaquinone biosynthesis C-methylase UbiE